MYICTFNVRSLSTTEKLLELKEAIKNIKYDVIGLSEVRRLGTNIIEDDDLILCYSGESIGQHGVGFLVNKELKMNIESFQGISGRVCTLQLKFSFGIMTLIQVYAPTERADDSEVESFYIDVQKAHDLATSSIIICMGDFNAKIGQPKKEESTVTGPFGYGKRNGLSLAFTNLTC